MVYRHDKGEEIPRFIETRDNGEEMLASKIHSSIDAALKLFRLLSQ